MARRVLRLWWQRQGGEPLDLEQTEDLRRLLYGAAGRAYDLPGHRRAYRGQRFLHLLPAVPEPPVTDELPAQDGAALCGITMRLLPSEGTCGDGRLTQELPEELLSDCVMRTRRTGDRIRPFGSHGTQSLQDYLTDHRVDAPFRDKVPLLARGQEILLVCGVGAGAVPRLEKSMNRVRLCWTGEIPWQP